MFRAIEARAAPDRPALNWRWRMASGRRSYLALFRPRPSD